MSRKLQRYISFVLIFSLVFMSFPFIVSAAVAPTITGLYQTGNHVKVEWSGEMADSDVLNKTGFESGEEIPNMWWGGRNPIGNQKIEDVGGDRVFQLTDTITNRSGNLVNFPDVDSDTSISSLSGKAIPAGTTVSINFKARAIGGTQSWLQFFASTGWFSRGYETRDYSGNLVIYGETVDYRNPPAEFSAYTDQGKVNYPDGYVLVVVSSRNTNYNYGVMRYTWIESKQKFVSQIDSYPWVSPSPLGPVGFVESDTFQAGEPVLRYGEESYSFPERNIPNDGNWITISSNAVIGNKPDYDYLLRGISARLFWKTNSVLQIDDLKFGFASEVELLRDGASIYRGYLSDYEDVNAIDKTAPNAPSNVNVNVAGRRAQLRWNPATASGTNYTYQLKGYTKNSGEILSSPKSVTVTSGIKGYSVVLDTNPNTIPPKTVTTTGTSLEWASTINGNFYAHIATINNQGNMSDVVHVPFIDTTKPTLSVTASTVDLTKGPVELTATAADLQTGVKRIQLPNGEWKSQEQVKVSVTQNGTYTFAAEDNAGNVETSSIQVSNIDTENPTISFTPSSRDWAVGDIQVDLKYEDLLSGVKERYYKVSSRETPSTWDAAASDEQTITIPNEGVWYIHAKAIDGVGNETVATTSALKLQKLPEVPQLKPLTADQTTASMEWTLPSGTTYTDGYRYQIQNVTTGQSWLIDYPMNQFTDTSLHGGQTVEYQVKAINHVGESAYSAPITVLTLPDAPAAMHIDKDERNPERAFISFDSVPSASEYRIVAKDLGTKQEVFQTTVTETVYQPITGMQPGVNYDISVSAINSNGEGPAIHSGYLSLPDAPDGFSSIQIGENEIGLSWKTVTSATYFSLERLPFDLIYGGVDTTHVDTGLESGSIYGYRVSAKNDTGYGPYRELQDIWTLPSPVSVIESVYAATDRITLRWDPVQGEEGYMLSFEGKEVTLDRGTTQFTVDGLDAGTTSSFTIKPFNRSGVGREKTILATTLPDAPAKVEAMNIQEQSARIEIAEVPGATKYKITINGKKHEISDTALEVRGIEGGKVYPYQVEAGNSAGYGQAVEGTILTLPVAPNNMAVKEHGATSLTLSWDPVSSAEHYTVMNSAGDELGKTEKPEWKLKGLEPGSSTVLFVKAMNATGEGKSASVTWRTLPDASGSTAVVNVTEHAASISWTAAAGADGYRILDAKKQIVLETKETSTQLQHLESATAYRGYTIVPFNATGEAEQRIGIPAFVTLPSSVFEVHVAAEKQNELKLSIEHKLLNEQFVITLEGKEVYRGQEPVYIQKGLKDATTYTFVVYTVNEQGDQSKKKEVKGKTKAAEWKPAPGSNGGGGSSSTTIVTSNPDPKKEEKVVTPQPDPKPEKPMFTDIDVWNKDQILALIEKGIIKGTNGTHFEPNRTVSRIEFVSMIVRALGLESKGKELTFMDTPAGSWYIPELQAAIEHGVAKGFSSREFRPNELLTREQAVVMLANVLATRTSEEQKAFTDSPLISSWAKEEVNGLTAKELVKGYPDGTFRPKAKMTRAESVALIFRMLELK
ncbi:S-layer homology domain-containing protein [Paenibacillus alvei]|uniref:S-layer homology domain-containing protein n=1 Tax=Paenibacillus alvei TaxID=44250 RepID=A0ABT4H2P3_PAEAL|nr:S-layer homology domain-containing protein [Paenibacillus alvei]MCY9763252.1 S-layer homology domain-containing protein [Paenibacillus alvei]MCY9769459.1 S-layer homology domain-containing protein [Paenibacillus alvei]